MIDCKWRIITDLLAQERRREGCSGGDIVHLAALPAIERLLYKCVCVSSYIHMFFEWMSCSIHLPELFHFLSITVVIALKKKNTSGQEISFLCFYPTSLSLSISFFVTVSFSPSDPSTKFSDGVAWIFDLITPKGNRSGDGDESQAASVRYDGSVNERRWRVMRGLPQGRQTNSVRVCLRAGQNWKAVILWRQRHGGPTESRPEHSQAASR